MFVCVLYIYDITQMSVFIIFCCFYRWKKIATLKEEHEAPRAELVSS